jgi:hypothetical protein
VIDVDGKVRIVLSALDPGVPNWVDTSGSLRGLAQWRWYASDRFPVPTTTLTSVVEVRKHLPAETPVISPDMRSEQLTQRRRQIGLRFNV